MLRTSLFRRLRVTSTLLAATLLVGSSQADAQPLTLQFQQSVTRTVPGATAAFALDPSRVGAVAKDGQLTLVGLRPGATHVIVIFGARSESFPVIVNEPPSVVLPGTVSSDSQAIENGHFELRAGTEPRALQSAMAFTRREGDRFTDLSLGTATLFDDRSGTRVTIPLASYTVRSPSRALTLLDAVVANSPLTVSRSNIRGLHVKNGPWQVHAGYNFFANFEHLLLSTKQQSVVGVGYRYTLGSRSSLTPHVYHYGGNDTDRRGGAVATLLYETKPARGARAAAELAVSRVPAGAAEIEIVRPAQRVWAKLRFAPPDLPSLATEQPSGRLVEGGWMKNHSKLTLNATLASHRYSAGSIDQASTIAGVTLQYRPREFWTIQGGPGYSTFDTARPETRIQNITLPIGVGLSLSHLGAGLDYQFARETERDSAGHLVRTALSARAGGFYLSGHWERQTQAPTAGYILAQVPWIQQTLEQQGITAGSVEQLADLLRTNAALVAFGYANSLTIDVTPVRNRIGASGGWLGRGRAAPQVFFSTLVNRDALISGTSHGAVHMASYSQKIGPATELFVSGSLTCHDRASSSSCRPVANVSIRRRLQWSPALFARRGVISGTVFRDDQRRGAYEPGMPTLPGVEVLLDGDRRAITGANGRFEFDRVSYGTHRVELRYKADAPFFLTTPSPQDAQSGSTVDFGVGAVLSRIRGVVTSDAGVGLPGVIVHVENAGRRLTGQTLDDGSFVVQGLTAGSYGVSIEAGSVPPGYVLQIGPVQSVSIGNGADQRLVFVLRPYRTVTGHVRLFNRKSGAYEPLPRTRVTLRGDSRETTSDENGAYVFRDLASGEYALVVSYEGTDYSVPVKVSEGPAILRDVDVRIVPSEQQF